MSCSVLKYFPQFRLKIQEVIRVMHLYIAQIEQPDTAIKAQHQGRYISTGAQNKCPHILIRFVKTVMDMNCHYLQYRVVQTQ